MINKTRFLRLISTAVLAAVCSLPAAVGAQLTAGTAFAHQGSLRQSGQPAQGLFDFQFALYAAAVGGSQIGGTITRSGVEVAEGLYSVNLDFGDVFQGQNVWLEIRVKAANAPTYTNLSPRRQITPVPYALYAGKANAAGTTLEVDSTKLTAKTVSPQNYGEARFLGPNSTNFIIGARSENRDLAGAQLFNEDDEQRVDVLIATNDTGLVQTYGSNDSPNTILSAVSSDTRNGYIGVYNSQSSTDIVGQLLAVPGRGGRLGLFDVNGDTRNVIIEPYSLNTDHGYLGVYDENDFVQVEIFVDTSRRGVIISDLNLAPISPAGKSVTHAYASLLGAELGLYERGTVQLINGQATVLLPAAFADVATPSTLTATLTPADASSNGLAVVTLSPTELHIQELQNGTGNYGVHYLVFAERNDIQPDKDGNKIPLSFFPQGEKSEVEKYEPVTERTF
ncbi:MAG: hypothetical protein ACFCU1_14125 [Sumerlaeia bacterium]